jgi:GNAT superfamily N-acetyltransferase
MREPVADSKIQIHALTAGRVADFLEFFDGEAFSDNPRWSFCYCQCFYEDHAKVKSNSRTAAENRALACQRIDSGRMHGHLAYRDGRVVGWCNAAPQRLLHALDAEPIPDADQVGTILCFLIDPRARRQGTASALLAAACEGFRSQGLRVVEANPHPAAIGPAANHFGPLGMFLAAGFSVHCTDPDGSVWVRKQL